MPRRKIPVMIYLEPEYHKHLEAIATQYQKSISMTGKELLLKAMQEEQRPLTVNERLDRLEKAVAEIKAYLRMEDSSETPDKKPKATAKAKAKESSS